MTAAPKQLPSRAALERRRALLLARSALDRASLTTQCLALDQDLSQRWAQARHWLGLASRVGRIGRAMAWVLPVLWPATLATGRGRRGLKKGAKGVKGSGRLAGRLLSKLWRSLPVTLPLLLRLAPALRALRSGPRGDRRP